MALKLEVSSLSGRVAALWNQGQRAAAREALAEATASKPETGRLWKLLGLVAFEMKDAAAAQSAIDRASRRRRASGNRPIAARFLKGDLPLI